MAEHEGRRSTEYFTELTQTDVREYLRPNLFANTPDILHEYLQHGGRPAFQVRLILAATLGASYGIYSGFELAENVPVEAGQRGVSRLGEVPDPAARLRRAAQPGRADSPRERRSGVTHPALQCDRGLRFHQTDNRQLIVLQQAIARWQPT